MGADSLAQYWHSARVNPLTERIVVLDTETSGLDPDKHSLLSIGLVDWSGRKQTEIFVNEGEIVADPASMAVNGIDLDFIRERGVTPKSAVRKVEKFLHKMGLGRPLMICGHNVAFDLAFMRRLYRMAGRDVPREFSHRSVDTHALLWALAAQGKVPREARSSEGAFTHFGVSPPPDKRHTALGDAIATRDLLEKVLELMK